LNQVPKATRRRSLLSIVLVPGKIEQAVHEQFKGLAPNEAVARHGQQFLLGAEADQSVNAGTSFRECDGIKSLLPHRASSAGETINSPLRGDCVFVLAPLLNVHGLDASS